MPGLLLPHQTLVFEGDSITNRRMPPTLDTWPASQPVRAPAYALSARSDSRNALKLGATA